MQYSCQDEEYVFLLFGREPQHVESVDGGSQLFGVVHAVDFRTLTLVEVRSGH